MIEAMEMAGVVSEMGANGNREVIIALHQSSTDGPFSSLNQDLIPLPRWGVYNVSSVESPL